MIKAVIFDCFGVLTTEGWQEFKETHFRGRKKNLKHVMQLNQLADEGKMTHEQLLPLVAELAGVSMTQAREEIDDYQTNKNLMHYIASDLKPKYKIGMLSNASDDWIEKMFTKEQRQLFDSMALSFNLGFTKPSPKAYQYIVDQLGVEMSESVFIDDRLHYVAAAKKLGMQGVHYKDFDQMKQELEQILEVSNTDK